MAEMIDCICCKAAIDELYKLPCKIDEDGYRWVLSRDVAHMIDSIPDADVRPVVHGHWERSLWFVTCSVCEYTSADTDDEGSEIALNFCPNCGADMREPNLDTTKGDDHD